MADSRQGRLRWELDELSYAGQEHLDAIYVAGYDQKSATDWSEHVAQLQALGIGASSTVVDLVDPGEAQVFHPGVARFRSERSGAWLDMGSARRARPDRTLNFHLVVEPMLERAGFEVRARLLSDDGIYAAGTCVGV
jgi:hypothetical protein